MIASSSQDPYNLDPVVTGSDEVVTDSAVIAAGQNLAANTVLGRVTASGELVAHTKAAIDGSASPVGILVHAIDASAAALSGPFYAGGTFDPDRLVWDAAMTAADKAAAFDRTPINLRAAG